MDPNNSVSDLYVLGAVGQAARDSATTQCMDTTNILQGQAGSNLANMANTDRLAIAVDESVHRQGHQVRDAVDRNSDWQRDAVNRNGSAALTAVLKTGSDILSSQERTSSRTVAAVERNGGEVKVAHQSIAQETRAQIFQHHISNQVGQKDIVINDNQNTGKIELQSSNYFGKTQLDISAVKSKLELQASNNTAAIQIESVKNKNTLSAQLAECCCELKQIVTSSAQSTQQVLHEIENNRIRDALSAATTENLISKLSS
jgi:hypothetical protein